MNSWLALLKKDLRFNQTTFLVITGFYLLIMGFIVYIAVQYQSGAATGISVAVFFLQIFLLPIMLLHSLHKEWKLSTSHLWLNVPQSGFKLLSSKFSAAILYHLVFILLAGLQFILMVFIDFKPAFGEHNVENILQLVKENSGLIIWAIVSMSVLLGALTTFIYLMSKTIRKIGWLIGILIIIGASWFWEGFVTETSLYRSLTEWGQLKEPSLLNTWHLGPGQSVSIEGGAPAVYLGSELVTVALILLIIFVSSWLLDNKVEA